jgi:hypothetical protein
LVLVIEFYGLHSGELAALCMHRCTRTAGDCTSPSRSPTYTVIWCGGCRSKARPAPCRFRRGWRSASTSTPRAKSRTIFCSHCHRARYCATRTHGETGSTRPRSRCFRPQRPSPGTKPKPSLNLTPHKLRHSTASIANAAMRMRMSYIRCSGAPRQQ